VSKIPLRQVRRIRTPADSVWDGAAKGAVIPVILWAVFCHSCSAEPMLRASLAYGLIGLATDALDTNRETLCRSRTRGGGSWLEIQFLTCRGDGTLGPPRCSPPRERFTPVGPIILDWARRLGVITVQP
jgi:hypothetical protein